MAEYIEREALLLLIEERKLNTCNGTVSCLQMQRMVERIPSADVAPVVHGHWIFKRQYHDADECNCSNCGQLMTTVHGVRMAYCPQCGFIMDGGADNG